LKESRGDKTKQRVERGPRRAVSKGKSVVWERKKEVVRFEPKKIPPQGGIVPGEREKSTKMKKEMDSWKRRGDREAAAKGKGEQRGRTQGLSKGTEVSRRTKP